MTAAITTAVAASMVTPANAAPLNAKPSSTPVIAHSVEMNSTTGIAESDCLGAPHFCSCAHQRFC